VLKEILVKTFFYAALIATALPSFGAGIESHQLTVNGKLIGNIVVIQGGVWAIPLQQLAMDLGAPITLEPVLSLQGNRLVVMQPNTAADYKPQKADGSLDAGVHFKYDIKAQKEARIAPGQFLGTIRPGEISSHVTMFEGRAYVPVADVIRAMGDGSAHNFTGFLSRTQNVNVNVPNNRNAIIAILVGL
jgi:hypothetical protein